MSNERIKTIALIAVLALAWQSGAAQKSTDTVASADPAATASSKAVDSAAESLRDRYPRYRLRAGDAFDISFELSPEFNQSVTVQPDGYITLRGIGDVRVADETVPQLTATLRSAYQKILNDPVIGIVLKDFEKPYFIADGQVARPGKYDLRGTTTLTEAIAMAGGFQESAKHSQVLLFRRVDDSWVSAKIFNVKKMEKEGNLSEDPTLHPGDMLFVPKNKYSKIKPFLPASQIGTFMRTY
jgi:protein involved in polysaccharide export with SLBB domain